MKKIILGCGVLVLVGFGFICLMFYTLTLPKYRDSSEDKPFSTIVNKKLTTTKKTLILVNPTPPKSKEYKYHLEDGTFFGMNSELKIIAEIPVGTEFIIDKVEIHTNRVSGFSSSYLFGKIYSNEKEYTFQYIWGKHHSLEDKPYWTFGLAFWQDEPLNDKCFIKTP